MFLSMHMYEYLYVFVFVCMCLCACVYLCVQLVTLISPLNYIFCLFVHLRSASSHLSSLSQMSLCGTHSLREISTPGKSGAVFYMSYNSVFLLKVCMCMCMRMRSVLHVMQLCLSTQSLYIDMPL